MKVKNILHIPNKTILTLEGDVLDRNAGKVVINGKEYDFDIAYDMKNTIGVAAEGLKCDTVDFV